MPPAQWPVEDPDVRAFLDLLRHADVENVVIIGGAVRDLLLGRTPRDIDIAVALDAEAPAGIIDVPCDEQILMAPALEQALQPLAAALGTAVDAFHEPLRFGSLTIDLVGLVLARDARGRLFPDVFVSRTGNIFGARPALSINRMWLDLEGRIRPTDAVLDLRSRIARLTAAPLPVTARQLLRALRYIEELRLHPSPQCIGQLRDAVLRLCDSTRFAIETTGRFVEAEISSFGFPHEFLPLEAHHEAVLSYLEAQIGAVERASPGYPNPFSVPDSRHL